MIAGVSNNDELVESIMEFSQKVFDADAMYVVSLKLTRL